MPEEIIYELTDNNMMEGNALPNIIMTRYEADKKEGFVGINTLGEVIIKQRFYHQVLVASIEPDGAIHAINWETRCNYDVSITDNTYFRHRKCFNGQEIKMVFVNNGPDVAMLGFDTEDGEPIKWLNGDVPYVDANSNAIITFYKSNEIIYVEIKRHYIGSGDSGGS